MMESDALEELVEHFVQQQKRIEEILDRSDLTPSQRIAVLRKINTVINLQLEGTEIWTAE